MQKSMSLKYEPASEPLLFLPFFLLRGALAVPHVVPIWLTGLLPEDKGTNGISKGHLLCPGVGRPYDELVSPNTVEL